MRIQYRLFAAFLAGAVAAGCATPSRVDRRWTLPTLDVPSVSLPQRQTPLLLDGDLREWADAPFVALQTPACIVSRAPAHEWNGPSDAGVRIHCAWNAEGLCLAADVTDDDVVNSQEDVKAYRQDCVEILVDPHGLTARPTGAQFWKFYLRPAGEDGTPAFVGIDPPAADFRGLRCAARRTPAGYTAEMIIPWTLWPEFRPGPGTELGLFFRLDEYDTRDGEGRRPLRMAYQGVADLGGDPRRMSRWVLSERVPNPARQALQLRAIPSLPWVVMDTNAIPIAVEMDKALPPLHSLRIVVADASGREVLNRILPADTRESDWGTRIEATVDCPPGMTDGYGTTTLVGTDAQGRVLLRVRRPVLVAASSYGLAMRRLEEARLPELAQTAPFRAASWLAVGVAVEKMKRAAETQNLSSAVAAAKEIVARVHMLDDGRLSPEDTGILRLLALTADPRARVVVEYAGATWASVTFYCGAIPLAAVWVEDYPDKADALRKLEGDPAGLASLAEPARIAGLPARIRRQRYEYTRTAADAFSPDRHVLLTDSSFKWGYMIDVAQLPMARVSRAILAPGCPEEMRRTVTDWAERQKIPLGSPGNVLPAESLLLAGDFRSVVPADAAASMPISTVHVARRFQRLEMAAGRQFIVVECPSRAVAEKAAAYVAAAAPLTPDRIADLRRELVRSMGPGDPPADKAPALPPGKKLLCGDMHMHTFYSDGTPSPVALALQAIYCNMDFAVLAEHNTLAGATIARRLLSEHGFDFPLSIGEEVTTPWSHLNAYPLREFISPKLTLDEIVSAAHEQGAVIQWNHPGYPSSEWSTNQMPRILEGSGLDAWEHYPPSYDEWKKAGRLPVITGTTDTHNGTFDNPERSILLAPAGDGDQVAAAVRAGNVVAITPDGDRLLYGPDALTAIVWQALSEGDALDAAKEDHLKAILTKADVVGLLRASPPKRIDPADLDK